MRSKELFITQSRIQHVKGHLVAFLRPRDGHQTLIAVVLRLVDLDHTATEVSNLINLGATLTNDGAHHVIGDVDLLRDGLPRNHSRERLACSGMRLGLRSAVRRRLMRTSSHVRAARRGCIVNRWLRNWRRGSLAVKIRDAIRARHGPVLLGVVSLPGVRVSVLPSSRLGNIRYHLHPTRHNTGRTAASSRVCRGSRPAKSLGQLLDESGGNVVCRNVDGIGHAQDDQGPLRRQRKTRVRRIQTRARGFLDLPNAGTALANDRTDEDMGDQETERVCLGLRCGWSVKGLIVESTNNQTKGLAPGQSSNRRRFQTAEDKYSPWQQRPGGR